MKKTIISIIKNLNEDYYNEIRSSGDEIMTFNHLSSKEINRDVYIEKVCDYIDTYIVKNNSNEKDISFTFVNSLLNAIDIKTEKKSREETYLNKAKSIAKEIKKIDSFNAEKLEDFCRIIVSLYCFATNKDIFDFNLSNEKLDKAVSRLKESKNYKSLFSKGKSITDVDVKYNKLVFSSYLLVLFYSDMLNNEPKSDMGD